MRPGPDGFDYRDADGCGKAGNPDAPHPNMIKKGVAVRSDRLVCRGSRRNAKDRAKWGTVSALMVARSVILFGLWRLWITRGYRAAIRSFGASTASPGWEAVRADGAIRVGHFQECEESFHVLDGGDQADRCAQRSAAGHAEQVEVLVHCLGGASQCSAPVVLGEPERAFEGARVAEASGTDGDSCGSGLPCHDSFIDDAPEGIQQVECDDAASVAGTGWPVDLGHRLTVAVAQGSEPAEEPTGQAHHSLMDLVDPDVVDPGQPLFQIGYLQEVESAVLEAGLVAGHGVPVGLHAGDVDRSAGEPGTF